MLSQHSSDPGAQNCSMGGGGGHLRPTMRKAPKGPGAGLLVSMCDEALMLPFLFPGSEPAQINQKHHTLSLKTKYLAGSTHMPCSSTSQR